MPFLSALALLDPKKPYEVTDDLESFFHVLTWCYLRFHHHSIAWLARYLSMFYLETHALGDGTIAGGTVKRGEIGMGMLTLTEGGNLFHEGNSQAFAYLILELADIFRKFYVAIAEKDRRPRRSHRTTNSGSERSSINSIITHDVMIEYFEDALQDTEWLSNDKLGDQFKELPEIGDAVATNTGTSKFLDSVRDEHLSRQAGGLNVSGKRSRTDELELELEPRPGSSKRSRTSCLSSKETLYG